MSRSQYYHDNIHWYMDELTSRIVAETGRPGDRHHLGKIILQGLRDDPDFVLQIDAGTDISETSGSVLQRSIRCAKFLKSLGLQRGDLIIITAPTHLDLAIPLYAALYLGVIVTSFEPNLRVYELQNAFESFRPKVIFSQRNSQQDIQAALDNLKMNAKIVTFDKGHEGLSFTERLNRYGGDEESFKAEDFDPDKTTAMLIPTSGTTGNSKACEHSHKYLTVMLPYRWTYYTKFPTPVSSMFVGHIQRLSTICWFLTSPFIRFTRVQSSLPLTDDHIRELINNYKPEYMSVSPNLMLRLLKPGEREKCDFTCFEVIRFGGNVIHENVVAEVKKVAPKTEVVVGYGLTEVVGWVFFPVGGVHKTGCLGIRHGGMQYKLVNIETQEEILEPNVPGELWLKGPDVFKGYYNNPIGTSEAVTKDGWVKTGDIIYRDEAWCYFFVERMKLRVGYMTHQVSPVEVESVILQHPEVLDAVVTGVPHEEYGELPVACVVRRPGSVLSANEIKDLVKQSLSDYKQLRGGVVFLQELPLTPSTKIHRRKLKEMVLHLERV